MLQTEMFTEREVAPPPPHLSNRDRRPSTRDADARRIAATKVAGQHADTFELQTDADKAAFVDDLVQATNGSEDGYELTKRLEQRSCCQGSSETVEALDEYIQKLHDVASAHEREWVRHFGIRPPLAVGTTVTFPWGWETKTGIISRIEESSAKFLIASEGVSGLAVIAYENAEPTSAAVTAT